MLNLIPTILVSLFHFSLHTHARTPIHHTPDRSIHLHLHTKITTPHTCQHTPTFTPTRVDLHLTHTHLQAQLHDLAHITLRGHDGGLYGWLQHRTHALAYREIRGSADLNG